MTMTDGPHSRACGIRKHDHGLECNPNCPTCGGKVQNQAVNPDTERYWEKKHRDLVSRLGFGDGITEPMADNDTIVRYWEENDRHANEWIESQLWRNDCEFEKGHDPDEDCYECDPSLRLWRAEKVVKGFEALADEWSRYGSGSTIENVMGKQSVTVDFVVNTLRNLLEEGRGADGTQ